ncbi:MAG: hypothetical protein ACJ8LN_04800, partial [Sulfurifustis sp.]
VLQHQWAELSEKCADLVDPAIKYGGGDEQIQSILAAMSRLVADSEALDAQLQNAISREVESNPNGLPSADLVELRSQQDKLNMRTSGLISDALKALQSRRGQ